MKVYEPSQEQPNLDRTLEELPEEEKPIFELFSQEQFIEKLIKFMSLEEQKGKDRFHSKHFTLFKVHCYINIALNKSPAYETAVDPYSLTLFPVSTQTTVTEPQTYTTE